MAAAEKVWGSLWAPRQGHFRNSYDFFGSYEFAYPLLCAAPRPTKAHLPHIFTPQSPSLRFQGARPSLRLAAAAEDAGASKAPVDACARVHTSHKRQLLSRLHRVTPLRPRTGQSRTKWRSCCMRPLPLTLSELRPPRPGFSPRT